MSSFTQLTSTDVSTEVPSDFDLSEVERARQYCGDRFEVMAAYAKHLSTTGVRHGLIGPREIPQLWTRHVLNCAVVQELIPLGAQVLDVGSGAGLPGLAIAIQRPDCTVVLLDSMLRRVQWLDMVVQDLALPQVSIIRDRAEKYRGDQVDVVTARAVAPLEKLLGWTVPHMHTDGCVLALKGASAAAEISTAAQQLDTMKVAAEVHLCGSGFLPAATTVVRIASKR